MEFRHAIDISPDRLSPPSPNKSQEGEQLSLIGPETAPFEYSILSGHRRTDGTWKSGEMLRSEYVHLSDGIIDLMSNGVEVLNPETQEIEKKPVDYVVFLDKSARPVSWLVKELWPILAKDSSGKVPEIPEIRFVNIDREQWISSIDPNNVGITNVDGLDNSIIRSLRSVFLEKPQNFNGKIDETIDNEPAQFDNSTVLIVDEVRSSGRTLKYATGLFKRAFPTASIVGKHWMSGIVMRNGAVGNADLPVWYSDKSVKGRGVGNRNADLSLVSNNSAQRRGARFLSTALNEPDPMSRQLRVEIRQLAKDVKLHRTLFEPALSRSDEDYERLATKINGMSFEEYKVALRGLKLKISSSS